MTIAERWKNKFEKISKAIDAGGQSAQTALDALHSARDKMKFATERPQADNVFSGIAPVSLPPTRYFFADGSSVTPIDCIMIFRYDGKTSVISPGSKLSPIAQTIKQQIEAILSQGTTP